MSSALSPRAGDRDLADPLVLHRIDPMNRAQKDPELACLSLRAQRDRLAILMIAALHWTLVAIAQPPNALSERLPTIAVSGDVEVDAIRIARERVSGQARQADLTNMRVALWLTSKDGEAAEQSLVRITELAPVYDNTDKLLSTEQRLAILPYLNTDVQGDEFQSQGDKSGHVIQLTFDAPAREATRIKSLKGTAVVTTVRPARLEFKDVKTLHKKVLVAPELKDLDIEVLIEVTDRNTEVELRIPRNRSRLMAWGLFRNNAQKALPPWSDGKSDEGVSKSYRGDQTSGTTLRIVVAEPVLSRSFPFEFRDLELP